MVSEPPGADSRSRRQLLMAAGAGAAGAYVLSGCGSAPLRVKVRGEAKVAQSDIAVLNRLLGLEQWAVAAYTAGIPLLPHRTAKAAKQFLGQDLAHAVELTELVKKANGKPAKPPASYDLGNPSSSEDVLLLLHRIENAQIAGYLDMIPSLSRGRLRSAVAAILANDAQHIAVIRYELGRAPIPSPFVTGQE